MIKEQRITYKSCRTDRDIDISAYFYLPEGEIKGIVQLSHGMCEYVERYEDLAEFLTKTAMFFAETTILVTDAPVKIRENSAISAKRTAGNASAKMSTI